MRKVIALLALLAFLPLHADAAGTRVGRKISAGTNYDRLPAGFKVFVQPAGYADGSSCGDGQSGATSINGAFYGGSGAANLWALTNVYGIQMRLRWCAIETSQGVYTYTTPDAIIAEVAAHGGTFGIYLVTRSYNAGTHSSVPSYITADFATYGGTSGHGGEDLSDNGIGYNVVWGNANVKTRWHAFIDSLAAKYKATAKYVYLDEFLTDGNPPSQVEYANAAAAAVGMEEQGAYCAAAFAPVPCFIKINYLSGDNYPTSTTLDGVITYLRDNTGVGEYGQEVAFPNPYDSRFSKPAGTTISDANLTRWAERQFEIASSRPRIWNTEYATSSTLDTTYNPNDCTNEMKYLGYLGRKLDSTTPMYFVLTATNGSSTSSGAWSCFYRAVTSGAFR